MLRKLSSGPHLRAGAAREHVQHGALAVERERDPPLQQLVLRGLRATLRSTSTMSGRSDTSRSTCSRRRALQLRAQPIARCDSTLACNNRALRKSLGAQQDQAQWLLAQRALQLRTQHACTLRSLASALLPNC